MIIVIRLTTIVTMETTASGYGSFPGSRPRHWRIRSAAVLSTWAALVYAVVPEQA